MAADNKQCTCIPKEDAKSTTVATDSVLLTCIVNSKYNRDIAVIDIPNVFIQTCVKEKEI